MIYMYMYKLSFSLPKMLHIKFGFDWPSVFRDVRMLRNYTCLQFALYMALYMLLIDPRFQKRYLKSE